jgi:transposase
LPEAHALIEQLHWQVEQLKKQLFGPSADRADLPESYSSEQVLLSLFPPPSEPPATQDVVLPVSEEKTEPAAPRPRRHPEIKALETEIQRIEPADKTCEHCGKEKCEIGCEKCERLEYIPAKMIRRIIERPKLACPCGEGKVTIAPPPPAPIEKGLPGAGLLAQVVLSKYEDHSPLYRQQQQFARLGVQIPRTTLCDWIEKGAELLQPIVRAMKEQLLAGDYLQVDETPVKLMDPEVQGKCATGFLWVAGRPGGDVIFEFKTRRDKESALELLGDFSGYLQRDGYGVYGSIVKDRPDITAVGCLAHGRRKFVEALADEPYASGQDRLGGGGGSRQCCWVNQSKSFNTQARRRRLAPQQISDLLARYQSAGFNQREFARREGVPLSSLQYWLRRAREGTAQAGSRVAASNRSKGAGRAGEQVGFVEVDLKGASGAVSPPAGCEIRYRDWAVTIPEGFSSESLSVLLESIRGQ